MQIPIKLVLFALLSATALVACEPSEVGAQALTGSQASAEVTGKIWGNLDGNHQEWVTFRIEGPDGWASTSNFGASMPMMTDISLQGHPDATPGIAGAFSIEFTVINGAIAETGLKYFPGPSTFPFYGDEEGSIEIEIVDMDLEAEIGQVSGRAHGRIFKTDGYTTPPDTGNAMEIDVEFQATVYAQ